MSELNISLSEQASPIDRELMVARAAAVLTILSAEVSQHSGDTAALLIACGSVLATGVLYLNRAFERLNDSVT